MSQLPTMPNQSPAATTPTTAQRASPKPEMWWMMLAKSKTLRFFAVSCEFLLFLGGLWITFTTTNAVAKTWLNGNLNLAFLTMMGWAVDAAMPEAWLHVVIQHVKQKTDQLAWSTFVAIGVSLLFLGNILYSIMTTSETSDPLHGLPSDAAGWVLLLLVLLRISIGFVYITVRQCQEWMDRQESELPAQQPPASQGDLQTILAEAIAKLAAQQEHRFTVLAQEQQQFQERLFANIQQSQQMLPLAQSAEAKEELIATVIERLQMFFAGRRTTVSTQPIATAVSGDEEAPCPHGIQQRRTVSVPATYTQPTHTARTESAKRPKRIDPTAVDSVVHPLLERDHSLTHRKIAALAEVPYTETVVYASVKRWRTQQAVVEGQLLKERSGEHGGVS